MPTRKARKRLIRLETMRSCVGPPSRTDSKEGSCSTRCWRVDGKPKSGKPVAGLCSGSPAHPRRLDRRRMCLDKRRVSGRTHWQILDERLFDLPTIVKGDAVFVAQGAHSPDPASIGFASSQAESRRSSEQPPETWQTPWGHRARIAASEIQRRRHHAHTCFRSRHPRQRPEPL